MRIGLVSDIHCNIEGLRSALAVMGDVDALFCAGDLMYEYRFQAEVLDLLREREAYIVRGNHDAVLLQHHGARLLASGKAQPHHLDMLQDAPTVLTITVQGKRIFMTHASPWDPPKEYLVPGHPKLVRFQDFDADLVLLGHTHHPMAERYGKTLVVNSGSCGITRNATYFNELTCAVVDLASEEVQILHFPDPRLAAGPLTPSLQTNGVAATLHTNGNGFHPPQRR